MKLSGKLLACVPTNKSADPNSIVVRIDPEQRAELLRQDPNVYTSLTITRRTPQCWSGYRKSGAVTSKRYCVTHTGLSCRNTNNQKS